MAMRVTAKMMQGNSLSNLNTNKALQDRLTTQLSTLKKITRPSDDPVIAIRSLRLNCTLSKVDQYYEKNSKDAAAWLKLTDDSLDTVTKILTDMKSYATQCANGDLKASDRSNIVMNLKALKEEIYGVGNADYEGRSIFTGYRTGLPLTFKEDFTKKYAIKEQITNQQFDEVTFVKTGDVSEINEGNYSSKGTQEYDVSTNQIHRFRTGYTNLDKLTADDLEEQNNYFQLATQMKPLLTAGSTKTLTIKDEIVRTPVEWGVSYDKGTNKMTLGSETFTVPSQGTDATVIADGVEYKVSNIAGVNGENPYIKIEDADGHSIQLEYTDDGAGGIDHFNDPNDATNTTYLDSTVQFEAYEKKETVTETIEVRFLCDETGKNTISINGGNPVNISNGAGNIEIQDPNGKKYKLTNVLSDNGVGKLTITDIDVDNGKKNNYEVELDYTVDNKGAITFDDQYFRNVKITDTFETATDEAYAAAVKNPDAVVYIASTGEFLFGDDIYQKISELSSDTELRVNYNKSEWLTGDLNPVHYFYTEDTTQRKMFYNAEKLVDPEGETANQVINYDMGNNQNLRVNTTADEVFTHDIGRDIEEINALLDQITEIEKVQTNVGKMIESGEYADDNLKKLEEEKKALDKSMTYLNDKLQKMSEKFITRFDGYLDDCNLALTKVGSREARQQLIDNRLDTQQTTFEELVSSNEDADLTELAVQLSSIELTYEASLSSISKVMKTTLLDFI